VTTISPVWAPDIGTTNPTACNRWDTTLSDQLNAMGCVSPKKYWPVSTNCTDPGVDCDTYFYTAWCPSVPDQPVDADVPWAVLSGCNQCTGLPPEEGWVLIAWADPWTCGALPGAGCNSVKCLNLAGP
jgi:hypothetical protein